MKAKSVLPVMQLAVILLSQAVLPASAMSKFEQLPSEERWLLVSANLYHMSYEEVIKLLGKPSVGSRDRLQYNLAEESTTFLLLEFDEGRVSSICIYNPVRKAMH